MAPTVIRPMALDDIEGLTARILADDWGDRRTWLEFVATHPACRAVVAVDGDGRPFATAVATVNGPVGWIGTVWVAPDRRRGGVGQALTGGRHRRRRGRRLPDAGPRRHRCRSPALRAPRVRGRHVVPDDGGSGAARPVRSTRASGHSSRVTSSGWRPLDAVATGEDRRHLIEAFATPASARVLERRRTTASSGSSSARHGAAARPSPRIRRMRCAILEARRRTAGPAAAGPGRDRPGECRGPGGTPTRRLVGGLAGAPARARRAAGLDADRDLGAVQPRPGVTGRTGHDSCRGHPHRWWDGGRLDARDPCGRGSTSRDADPRLSPVRDTVRSSRGDLLPSLRAPVRRPTADRRRAADLPGVLRDRRRRRAAGEPRLPRHCASTSSGTRPSTTDIRSVTTTGSSRSARATGCASAAGRLRSTSSAATS